MRKILLNKKRSKNSVNDTNIIPVEFNRDVSMFHDEIMSDTINTMSIYNDEKNNSKKHRFIFTLSPICTNVLFNNITEVVYKEGSAEANVLTNDTNDKIWNKIKSLPFSKADLTRKQAIRNTEYSNSIFEINYHCGSDIFNNHLLRKKEGISVQKKKIKTGASKGIVYYKNDEGDLIEYELNDCFNTILDINRNKNGETIKNVLPNSDFYYNPENSTYKGTPLYYYDNIKTFKEAFSDITRKNGWLGFNNPTTVYIPIDDNGYSINKCINNIEGCEFIDMTPERDLFYFTPKKNEYRKRLEYNWNYVLTYPYKSEYNDGKVLLGKGSGLPLSKFETGQFLAQYINSGGIEMLYFRSPVKHNLQAGDKIKFIFDTSKSKVITITGIGNIENKETDRCFYIRKSDIHSYFYDKNDVYNYKSQTLRFTKVVDGYDCEYYFRKFKKIGDYRNVLNRLGFSDTIYGDEISQIVFTEDVNLEGLKDNRGRDITEIYLTIIKNNSGYKEWYINAKYNDDNVEYSHVFGELTSGLDIAAYSDINLPVIRKQHNIDIDSINLNDLGIAINKSSTKLETCINKEFTEFYGDLVEFNPMSVNETVLEPIFYRFNTAQREIIDKNGIYDTIFDDEIYIKNGNDIFTHNNTFKPSVMEHRINKGFANLAPEGYIYKPHHKIKIGEFSNNIKQGSNSILDVKSLLIRNNNKLCFETTKNYVLLRNDIVSIVDKNNFELYRFIVDSYDKNEYGSFSCSASVIDDKISNISTNVVIVHKDNNDNIIFLDENDTLKGTLNKDKSNTIILNEYSNVIILLDEDGDKICELEKISNNIIFINKVGVNLTFSDKDGTNTYILNEDDVNINILSMYDFNVFKHNIEIPEYAYMIPDETGRHIWREVIKPSEWGFQSSLYNIPFTNGSFYHHKNVILPIKRQDPFKINKMFIMDKEGHELENNFEIPSTEIDISSDEYITSNNSFLCF